MSTESQNHRITESRDHKKCFCVSVFLCFGDTGQGLLEAVIAICIIVTGIVAALTLAIGSLSAGVASESRIIATNLSREGIEVVRNIRDSNWVAGGKWDLGLDSGEYMLTWEAKRMELVPFQATSNDRLYYSASDGVYTLDAGFIVATPFYRRITIADICEEATSPCSGADSSGADRIGIRVTTKVWWERRGVRPATPQMEVVADLYAWR